MDAASETEFVKQLGLRFKINPPVYLTQDNSVDFIGIDISIDEEHLYLSMEAYHKKLLSNMGMADANPRSVLWRFQTVRHKYTELQPWMRAWSETQPMLPLLPHLPKPAGAAPPETADMHIGRKKHAGGRPSEMSKAALAHSQPINAMFTTMSPSALGAPATRVSEPLI